ATQGLALLGRALARSGTRAITVEDPGLPPHRAVLAYAGLEVHGAPVDEEGLDVEQVSSPVVLTTPAHQLPMGGALSPARRSALIRWARAGGLVIEDDYDAEFRYDRAPLGALQGLAPDRVVYLGTASKTLAPGLRLGWLVLPAWLRESVVEAKLLDDLGSSTIEQLVLARLLETAAYDRHLRKARRRNRARRDALMAAVAEHLPQAKVTGIAAGLHALVCLPQAFEVQRLMVEAWKRSLGVYPLAVHLIEQSVESDALVLGYGNLSEPAIVEGIRRLGAVLEALWGSGGGAGETGSPPRPADRPAAARGRCPGGACRWRSPGHAWRPAPRRRAPARSWTPCAVDRRPSWRPASARCSSASAATAGPCPHPCGPRRRAGSSTSARSAARARSSGCAAIRAFCSLRARFAACPSALRSRRMRGCSTSIGRGSPSGRSRAATARGARCSSSRWTCCAWTWAIWRSSLDPGFGGAEPGAARAARRLRRRRRRGAGVSWSVARTPRTTEERCPGSA